jgi:16S rRNA (cytosine967-C5)-methyltransferase
VDAPCSGIGGMRREPDLRWRLEKKEFAELPALQRKILESALGLVRVGGRLVYATCSPLRAEGEAVVEAFLAAHQELRAVEPAELLTAAPRATSGPWMRVTPELHDTGAFFAAVLRRER